jgi:poly(3-hydroxybutyrate) depolymerase
MMNLNLPLLRASIVLVTLVAASVTNPVVHRAAAGTDVDGYTVSGDGFVNHVDVLGPLKIRKMPPRNGTMDLFSQSEKKKGWKPLGQASSDFDVWPAKRMARGFLVRGTLESAKKERVWLRLGLTGVLDLYVNGKRVYRATDRDFLLPDDHEVQVSLREGSNRILLRLESLKRLPLRFTLRVRDEMEKTPEGLRWVVSKRNRSSCALVASRLSTHISNSGWTTTLNSRFGSLRPFSGMAKLWLRRSLNGEILERRGSLLEQGLMLTIESPFGAGGKGEVSWGIGSTACGVIPRTYRPALAKRLVVARELAQAVLAKTDVHEGDRESLEHALERAEHHILDDVHASRASAQVERVEELCSTEKSRFFESATGVVHRAYRSKIDQNRQPYVVYVPRAYTTDKTSRFPLVITFHGLGFSPEETLRITLGQPLKPGQLALDKHPPTWALRDPGVLVLAVNGYGSVGHRTLGEMDVLHALEEVKRSYRVDDERVSITGFSLGGTAAFVLPLHHPSLFAASAPLCGYPNLDDFYAIKAKKKQPWEHILIRQRAIVEYAKNGRNLPMKVFHGAEDNPKRSQVMVDRYRELGYRVDFKVYEDLGHRIWHRAYRDGDLLRWLSRQRRPSNPKRVSYRSRHRRYDRAHWVQLLEPENQDQPWRIDGRQHAKGVRLRTSNVSALTLHLKAAQKGVRLDGQPVAVDSGVSPLSFKKGDTGWAFAGNHPSSPTTKRHGLSGPIDDIWNEGFVIVVGTQDPVQTEANLLAAQELRRFNYRTRVEIPIVSDVDASEAQLRKTSLMLIGNPASNSVTAKAIAKLPLRFLRFEKEALVFGGKRFVGKDVGISLIQPSPFNRDHYMVLHAGVGRIGTLSARNLPAFVPDYLVYDKRIRTQYGAKLLDKRRVLEAGFFASDWGLPPR